MRWIVYPALAGGECWMDDAPRRTYIRAGVGGARRSERGLRGDPAHYGHRADCVLRATFDHSVTI